MKVRKQMKKYKDIEIGDKFGNLTVIAYAGRIQYDKKNNRKHWICLCDCGQEKLCNDSLLKNGGIKSCGCLKISKEKNKKRYISNFVEWCNNNMDKNIYDIWNYEDNLYTPDTINCKDLEQTLHLFCPIHGNYSKKLKRFLDNPNCSFCMAFDKDNILSDKLPKIVDIWSDKNGFSPNDIGFNSTVKVWLKCSKNKHEDYLQYIRNAVRSDCECPKCVKERRISKGEMFVSKYLSDLGYNVLHEYDCNIIAINPITKRTMPYDNEIPELKLIVEVHGLQHYQTNSTWNILNAKENNITPEESLIQQRFRDDIKRQYAIKCGYCFVEIPYWHIYDDSFKKIIDEKITEISQRQS